MSIPRTDDDKAIVEAMADAMLMASGGPHLREADEWDRKYYTHMATVALDVVKNALRDVLR